MKSLIYKIVHFIIQPSLRFLIVIALCLLTWMENAVQAQVTTHIVRVDGLSGAANPANHGSGWGSDAFLYFRDAIVYVNSTTPPPGQNDPYQIWVRGKSDGSAIYKPDAGYLHSSSRSDTFAMANFTSWYGGFEGTDNTEPFNHRNPVTRLTILSGDIGTADDTSDNSYHVVTGASVNITGLLDGFTITKGNATGSPNVEVPPIVTPAHTVNGGGGMILYELNISNGDNTPNIVRCKFDGNQTTGGSTATVGHGGGAVLYYAAGNFMAASFYDCVFSNNTTDATGGAILNAGLGSAVCPAEDDEELGTQNGGVRCVNCLFVSNSSGGFGGALSCDATASLSLVNCTITLNTAAADAVNSAVR